MKYENKHSQEQNDSSERKEENNFHGLFTQHFNLLKPICYVMHHQFNIQQLYALPTPYLCVLYLSEKKQWLVSLTA